MCPRTSRWCGIPFLIHSRTVRAGTRMSSSSSPGVYSMGSKLGARIKVMSTAIDGFLTNDAALKRISEMDVIVLEEVETD